MDSPSASIFLDDSNTAATGDRGRDSLLLLARLKVEGMPNDLSVRVRNLSAGGLMAELPEPVSPESAVQIELRGIGLVSGRVAWQTEGRAGIAFDRPIDPQRARKPVSSGNPDQSEPRTMRFPG